jgi:hypothetical protein
MSVAPLIGKSQVLPITFHGEGQKAVKTQNLGLQMGSSKDIHKILVLFQQGVNPTINFANKTERASSKYLIDKFGYDKVVKMIEYAISIQGEMYAPCITTPWELKTKLAKLIIYYKKSHLVKPKDNRSKRTGKNYDI